MPRFEIDAILTLVRNKTVQQSGLLIGVQGVAMACSFILTALITNNLNVEAYGTYRYAMTFLALAMTLLQVGWPYSVARLLALQVDPLAQKRIIGASVMLLLISTLAGILLIFAAYFALKSFGLHLPHIVLWISPFLYVTLGQQVISSICQGLNQIFILSSQQMLPYLMLLPITAAQIFIFHNYSLLAALLSYVLVFTAVISIGFWRLGVILTDFRSSLKLIAHENRRTGFPIYLGGVFGVASTHFIIIGVAAFVSSVQYGHYALAVAVSAPLSVLVSSIGTVVFRSSSKNQALSAKVLAASFGFGALLVCIFLLVAQIFLTKVFGSEYQPSIRMAQILGLGSLLIGWGDIFQRFLGAQGLGKHLCLAATCTGTVNVLAASFLLPRFNAFGAIASFIMASTTYFGLMLATYIQYTNRISPRVPMIRSEAI